MKKTVFIVLINLGFFYQLFSQKIDTTRILITLDKIEYNGKEKVKVEIINNSNDTLYVYDYILYQNLLMQEFNNGKWLYRDICLLYNGIEYIRKFIPKEKINYNWDQMAWIENKIDTMDFVNSGKYRFQFNFWTSNEFFNPSINESYHEYRPYFLCYSKEFLIK